MNLTSILQGYATAQPDKTAVEFHAERLSYAELWQRIESYAGHLHNQDITSGDRVGLALKEHVPHLILHYAIARLGAVILPVDHRWTTTEKIAVASAFQAKLIIVEENEESLGQHQSLTLSDECFSGDTEPPPVPDTKDLPLLISLSSGTTGKPKGALVTHEQMYQRFVSQWKTIGFNSRDRFVGLTPLYFGAGRSFGMAFLAAGATVILDPPPHEPQQLIAAINNSDATATFLVPTQLRGLVPLYENKLLLPSLKKLLISGAALYPDEAMEIQEKINPNLIGYYASSEGGGISVLNTDEFPDYAHTVGRPTYKTEIQIVDENNEQIRLGETGRLRYRGPGVASRFIDSDGKPEPADKEGWFYPGDLACILDSGHVALRGRDKDVINRGGVKIYPAEIEATLIKIKSIKEVAVLGQPSKKYGETAVAFIVCNEPVSEEILDKHCKNNLAPYKVPSRYLLTDTLPKKTSGKLDKEKLLKLLFQ